MHIVAWCLGGIMTLLTAAHDQDLPIASITTVASPFDSREIRIASPLRPVTDLAGGLLGTVLYRALGGAPQPIVKRGFQLTILDKYLTRPYAMLRNLHDREFLASIEAVDRFIDNITAYPGRTAGQLYHRFFRVNELADGRLRLGDQTIDIADVRLPVLAVAGDSDRLAPPPAVHHVKELLPKAAEVRLETAPGGHLGALTGRGARATTWAFIDAFVDAHHPVESTTGDDSAATPQDEATAAEAA